MSLASGKNRTRVIAHRGASGYLPEHTAAAKALAFGLGADFIEQDVIATRDRELVVLHDPWLDDVSDVARKYPSRRRDDGHFYVIDFDLAELGELCLVERRQPHTDELRYPGRFPYALPAFRVQRFEDEILLVSGLNASTGRSTGIYPEIKAPRWHAAEGNIDLTRLVHEALERSQAHFHGPIFVQSFDSEALKRLKFELDAGWPLIQLLDDAGAASISADPGLLVGIKSYAVGIGLPYTMLVEAAEGGRLQATSLLEALSDSRLLVHPYTLRRDVAAPAGIAYVNALSFLIREIGVDAIFCDQPDDAIRVRDGNAA